jgi:hypothetical protein
MGTFKNLSPGDRVKFRSYGGLKIAHSGKVVPEFKTATGTVQRFLCFEEHVIVAIGNRPYVVDHGNFISKIERKQQVAA